MVACAAESPDDELGSSSQEVTAGAAIGSWDGTTAFAQGGKCQNVYATSLTHAGFTQPSGSVLTDTCGFQCVELAVRYFHYRKGIAASSWHVGTAIEMCNARPSGVSLTSSPVAGDLVVLKANDPAVGTGSAGHVAVVTAVNSDNIATFNENWANDTTAFATISRSRDVACFLHAAVGVPYQVTGADNQGLAVLGQPHAGQLVRWAANGTTLFVVCQTKNGDWVDGRKQYDRPFTTWDKLSDGNWVYDWYMNTPPVAMDGYSPGIAHCSGG
jgi:hypothetical protein